MSANDEKLIVEAAKLTCKIRYGQGWDETLEWAQKECLKMARVQRDFWAAHNEPAEMDTATILRKAAEYYRWADDPVSAEEMLNDADRLDREQQENARDIEIGRKAAELWDARVINDDTDAAAYGREIRKLVEADQ